MRANRRIKYTSRANGTFELLYTFVSRRANRSVMYIREARKGVENPWSLPDPTGTFKVLSFRWQPNRFSLSLFSAFPLVFFLLSPSTHIRWRIVLLKRVLLTNGSLFLSFSAFSFFLFFSLSTEIRGSSNHHCQRWNSDRKIRENDRVAARQSSKASMKNLRGEISRELRLSRSS